MRNRKKEKQPENGDVKGHVESSEKVWKEA